jgi:hypothetical protein
MVRRLEFGGRHVAERPEEPPVVEPVHPLERRELDCFDVPPWPTGANNLGLEEADDRLRKRVVVRITDASDRALDAGLGEPLRVPDGQYCVPRSL